MNCEWELALSENFQVCERREKAIDMNNIEQRMAGFIQGPCAPLDGLQGLGRNNICVLQFRNIYVLRVEPNPTFISHQTVSASHKLTPLYHYVWERSVNIWWWGLYSTIEEKKKKKKRKLALCLWSICASLVWTRSSTIHHVLIWRSQLWHPVMALLINGWDDFTKKWLLLSTRLKKFSHLSLSLSLSS